MPKMILLSVLSLLLASNIFGFNLDPVKIDVKLKKTEQKEVLFRIKNIYAEPIIVEVSTKQAGLVTKIKPNKLRIEKNGYTYVSSRLTAPADTEADLSGEIVFKISGVRKGSKIGKTVIVPVGIEIITDVKEKGKEERR